MSGAFYICIMQSMLMCIDYTLPGCGHFTIVILEYICFLYHTVFFLKYEERWYVLTVSLSGL